MRKLTTSVSGVYVITCIETGKVYVGQSENCTRRFAGHKRDLISGKHRNYHLRRAWDAYGPTAFSFDIIAEPLDGTRAALDWLEVEVLRNYADSYNLMEVGDLAPRPVASDETRAKLGALVKARWADPAYRERLKASHARRNADPEYRERHRAAMLAFNATPEGKAVRSRVANDTWAKEGARERRGAKTKGHWDDPEHRAKQEASRKAAWEDPEKRRRRVEGLKRGWDALTPEQHKARADAANAHKADPRYRAAQAERTRASWEKRRAKKP